MDYPEMFRIRQNIQAPRVVDIEKEMDRQLAPIEAATRVNPGSSIAITAGSRGIANIDRVLKRLVDHLRQWGAKPFIVPAMGSHGGATAEGQVKVLESLNITEAHIGAPVRASMEVTEIARSEFGFPVLVDRLAAAADGLVVVNRIKPHTEFEGPIESGLMKMMAIGMGNHQGCFQVHKQTVNHGYRRVIPAIGRTILKTLPVLFGIGIVENIYDETAYIRAIPAEDIYDQEKALLTQAKQLMAQLPVDRLDVLIVDEIGKNISGTGMDTNVIGRIMFIGEKEPDGPTITRIVALDITDASHGNAVGIGLADYTVQRLVDKLDLAAVATNAITAMTPEKGRIPIALPTDREAVEAALHTIGAVDPANARIAHIKNTLEMSQLDVSAAVFKDLETSSHLELVSELGALRFDDRGELAPVPMP